MQNVKQRSGVHFSLDVLTELTEDCRELFSEFQQLQTEARQTVPETTVAAEINRLHNRYADIGQ